MRHKFNIILFFLQINILFHNLKKYTGHLFNYMKLHIQYKNINHCYCIKIKLVKEKKLNINNYWIFLCIIFQHLVNRVSKNVNFHVIVRYKISNMEGNLFGGLLS